MSQNLGLKLNFQARNLTSFAVESVVYEKLALVYFELIQKPLNQNETSRPGGGMDA